MKIIRKVLKQDCVFWRLMGNNEFNEPEYAEPIDLKCRWEDVIEEFVNSAGETVKSRSKVMVGEEIEVEGQEDEEIRGAMRKGTKESIPSDQLDGDPFAIGRVFSIQRFDRIPTIDAKEMVRIAYL